MTIKIENCQIFLEVFNKMSIKVIDKLDNRIDLQWKNTSSIFLNTLRRIMISDIPTIAIDKIELEENSSPMNDEFMAHRIGLIPIRCERDVSSIPYQHECTCKNGCHECNFEFILEKENKDNDDLVGVYSSDFVTVFNPKHNFNVVTYPIFEQGILICKLARGQKIKLKAIAIKGTGKEHSKWSSVSCVSFVDKPNIKIKNLSSDLKDTIINSCPTNVYKETNGKLVVNNENNCTYCMECVNKSNNQIEVGFSQKNFIMTIESNGSIDPLTILKNSLVIWKDKIKFLNEQIHHI